MGGSGSGRRTGEQIGFCQCLITEAVKVVFKDGEVIEGRIKYAYKGFIVLCEMDTSSGEDVPEHLEARLHIPVESIKYVFEINKNIDHWRQDGKRK